MFLLERILRREGERFHGKSIGKNGAAHQGPYKSRVGASVPLLSLSLVPGEEQLPESLRHMEIRRTRARGSPRRIKSRFLPSFDAVEIHPPRRGGIKACHQALHGYGQLRDPYLRCFIADHAPAQSALQVMFFAGCDVEINPEAVGAHLKLFVSAETRSIRLQKHFGHIAIPKLLPSPVPLGIWENRDGPVFRPKPQKQSLGRRQQSHFGLALSVRIFPLPVGVEAQRHGSFPGRRRRESFRIERLRDLNRHSLPRF